MEAVRNVIFFIFASQFITGTLSLDIEEMDEEMGELFPAIMEAERSSMGDIYNQDLSMSVYDFIVIGAGAAGCAVASRLSEVQGWNVLLLEAGEDETAIMDIPYLAGRYLQTDSAWKYQTVPSKSNSRAFVDQKLAYELGKVMGGGTTLNNMAATRGNRRDYDNWENMGNYGWGYESVLPYFKKIENVLIPDLRFTPSRSTKGNIDISFPAFQSPISSIFLEAAEETGHEIGDYNTENQTKFYRSQMTMRNSTRWSSYRGYIQPARNRQNLYIKTKSTVNKIIIDSENKTASGVLYERNGVLYTALAKREVIVSAGTVKSAQLLMLSGIGPKDHLESLSIPVVADLPVGNNLMDHAVFYGFLFTINQTAAFTTTQIITNISNYVDYFKHKKGPLTTSGPYETIGFIELKNSSYYSPGWPNVEVIVASSASVINRGYAKTFRINDEVYDEFLKPLTKKPTFQILLFTLRPKSRGTVRLRDLDVNSEPDIDPRFYSNPEDVHVAVEGIKETIKITKSKKLQELGIELHDIPLPPCKSYAINSDDYWDCALKQLSATLYHPSGTCKMGLASDESSVVSPELRVHGVKNLRVIDASIMPMIISGHLMLPTYMIAEKGSDLIMNTHMNDR